MNTMTTTDPTSSIPAGVQGELQSLHKDILNSTRWNDYASGFARCLTATESIGDRLYRIASLMCDVGLASLGQRECSTDQTARAHFLQEAECHLSFATMLCTSNPNRHELVTAIRRAKRDAS